MAEVLGRFDRPARERAAQAFHQAQTTDPERIDRWVEQEGLVVSTGQQPGLFGGPLLTLYKAATAIGLAALLEQRLGRPVLPVFWVASEDHDWSEIDHTWLPDAGNSLLKLTLPTEPQAPERALRSRVSGEGVTQTVAALRDALPPSEFRDRWLRSIEGAYLPETGVAVAFRDVLLDWLGELGLIVVDASDPAIKQASTEILSAAIRDREAHHDLLSKRAAELEAVGWSSQVPLIDGALNLFADTEEGRQRVVEDGSGGLRLRETDTPIGIEDLEARIADPDEGSVSPNALLRPVVESAVFPVIASILGPSELAYHAQIPPLFEAFGIEPAVLLPRASFAAVEKKIGKVLGKLDLSLAQLARPKHELEGAIARDALPDAAVEALGRLRRSISEGMDALEGAGLGIDPTLSGPIGSARGSALSSVDDAERKILQAVKRTQAIAQDQLAKAQLHIRPLDRPQERAFTPLYFLARYDDRFLDQVHSGVQEYLSALLDPASSAAVGHSAAAPSSGPGPLPPPEERG
jgi:bacillithiol biosynthesis cysteine-adding enzyme BshC